MIKTILARTHAARTYALAVGLAIVAARYVPGQAGTIIVPIVAGVLGLPLPQIEADAAKVADEAAKVAPAVASVVAKVNPAAVKVVDAAADAVTSLAK